MENQIIISVENVSKIYKLYDNLTDRLKEALNPLKKIYHKNFYALEDVSFHVKKGETVGIIGTNGSGKSTLLKLIVGIISPTSGSVIVNGKIAALLELGAGFNPEYTGMENIFLQGTMFGFTKDEMSSRIESIIEFADIGEFVNQPVKNYSSGMFARLAFAIAINIEPEILIVDEALSVGDIFFQNKCFKKMEEIKSKGTTILFVSHDLFSVKQFCDRAVWLSRGKVIENGEVEAVCNAFQNSIFTDINKRTDINGINLDKNKVGQCEVGNSVKIKKIDSKYENGGNGKGRIISFMIMNSNGEEVNTLKVGESYDVQLYAKFEEALENVIFGVSLENKNGFSVIGWNTFLTEQIMPLVTTNFYYGINFKFELPKIQKGEYIFAPAIAQGTQDEHVIIDWFHNAMTVYIENGGYNLSIIEIDTQSKVTKYLKEEVEILE